MGAVGPPPKGAGLSPRYTGIGVAALLLVLAAACGEFHTQRFIGPADSAPDTLKDAAPDVPRCEDTVPLCLAADLDLSDLVAGVPIHRILVEETGNANLWLVIAGALPPGLTLDPLSGALSGVPEGPAEGTFTVRVTAEDRDDLCFDLDEATYAVTVAFQCNEDEDCTKLVSPAFLEEDGWVTCGDGDRCLASDGCPNDPRQRARFLLGGDAPPPPGEDGIISGGEVIRHARIQGQKNPDDLRRQILVVYEDANSAVLRLDYTLPGNWPLPLREGDPVALRIETSDAGGAGLLLIGPGGPVRLLDGLWIPGAFPPPLALPDLASLLPLLCPGIPDECGDRTPAAVTFLSKDHARTLTPGKTVWMPDPTSDNGDDALLARLGWSAFRGTITPTPDCAGAPPVEISALFFPADDCPGAVAKAESPQDLVVGQALAEVPICEVSGWGSFSPSPEGSIVMGYWSVEADPLGGGFGILEALPMALPDPAGLGKHRLRAGAVGEYRIGLAVEDQAGRTSCITDTIRFRVFPDPDVALRAELIWLPLPALRADDNDLDHLQLLMRPSGNAAWDDPDRVCGPASPLPEFFEGAQCAPAALLDGRPALATLATAEATKTYGFALRAPETNAAPMVHAPGNGTRIVLRIFCNAEAMDLALPDGFTLVPGDLVEVARVAPGCVLETLL